MVKPLLLALAFSIALPSCAQAQQTVLFDFYSPSCGPCRHMDPVVSRLKSAGYPVRKVNIMGSAAERAIAAEFGVQKVPTFVMVAGGWEAGRVVGATSYEHLEQMVRQAVEKKEAQNGAQSSLLSQARGQSPDPKPKAIPAKPEAQAWPASKPSRASSVYGRSNSSRNDVPARSRSANPDPLAIKLVNATVRLRISDSTGRNGGTGTIIDSRSGEALILTCGHIFRQLEGRSTIMVELFEALPNGVRVVKQVPGQVEAYDLDRDIGLVSIRPGIAVQVAPIAQPAEAARQGEEVISVGCNLGDDPTVVRSQVTAVNRYLGTPNVEIAGAPVEGRSGGGLFNHQGKLVGVCQAADSKDDEGIYASLAAVYEELQEIGLSGLFLQNQPLGTSIASTSSTTKPTAIADTGTEQPLIRGQEPLQPVRPVAALGIPASGQESASPMSAVEQAAWDEIMGQASEAEIVCIIRPKSPDGKSQIIRLSKASGQFVRKLIEQSQ